MDKDLTQGKLYQIIDQFIERKITPMFYAILLNKTCPFYDGNGRASKIMFTNNEIMNLRNKTKSIKIMESQNN